jgi:histidinol-phosphatase (PHP family)
MPILVDYHTHTPRCKHAAGPMEAYVERAISLGLREIGFSDHNPLPDNIGINVRMEEAELDAYVADVLRLQERYRGTIQVRLGLEMDYIEGLEPYLETQRRRHPWDYVIGSVHYLDRDGRQLSWPRNYGGDIHAVYDRYYALVRQLARTGFYDIVAHFDLPKRTGIPATERQAETVTTTLQELARTGMAVEINTSGFRHPELAVAEPYPNAAIVAEAMSLGVPLLVNSDAHSPGDVGTAFVEMEIMLKSLGCKTLSRYAAGQRFTYPL